jgi:hypothetical protein
MFDAYALRRLARDSKKSFRVSALVRSVAAGTIAGPGTLLKVLNSLSWCATTGETTE